MKQQQRIFQPEKTACKVQRAKERHGRFGVQTGSREGNGSIEFNGQSSKR